MQESKVPRSSLGSHLPEVWRVHLGNVGKEFWPQRVTGQRKRRVKRQHIAVVIIAGILMTALTVTMCSPSTECRVAAHMAQKTTLPDVTGI